PCCSMREDGLSRCIWHTPRNPQPTEQRLRLLHFCSGCTTRRKSSCSAPNSPPVSQTCADTKKCLRLSRNATDVPDPPPHRRPLKWLQAVARRHCSWQVAR